MATRRRRRTSKAALKKELMGAAAALLAALLGLLFGTDGGRGLLPDALQALMWGSGTAVSQSGAPLQLGAADTAVHFIDVGQGDSVLVQQGDHFALIDAGVSDAKEDILAYLESAGVERLELLVMTHPHADHIGSMAAVIQAYPVEQMLLPDLDKAPEPTTVSYTRVLDALEAQNVPTDYARVGDTYALGDGAFTVLGAGVETSNYNDLSTVLRFDAGDFSFVCSGDGEKEVEQAVLAEGRDLGALVYKAAHHGSDTSNTLEFLQAIHPSVVVVSCGEGNSYGHPHKEPMERFDQIGAQVFRTDTQGSVVVTLQDGALQVYTAKDEQEAA